MKLEHMKLKPEIYSFIKELNNKFRDGLGLDLPKVLSHLNITVKDAEFDNSNIAGAIENDNGNWMIYVKDTDFLNRKRFTVCHELGHYISWMFKSLSFEELDTDGTHTDFSMVKSMNRSDDTNEAEQEANEIAGCLLMPENLVKSLIDDEYSIEGMSDEFGVSISAMTIRLQKLGYDLIEN